MEYTGLKQESGLIPEARKYFDGKPEWTTLKTCSREH